VSGGAASEGSEESSAVAAGLYAQAQQVLALIGIVAPPCQVSQHIRQLNNLSIALLPPCMEQGRGYRFALTFQPGDVAPVALDIIHKVGVQRIHQWFHPLIYILLRLVALLPPEAHTSIRATVHIDDLPGDKVGAVRGEEGNQGGDILR
jgi:hypothetical protein